MEAQIIIEEGGVRYTRDQWMLKQILDELKSINATLKRLVPPQSTGGGTDPPAEFGKP